MNNDSKPQTEAQKNGALVLAALKKIQDGWPAQIEVIAHKAQVCKTKYDEALAKGFTEQQALEICTKDWSW